MGLAGVFSSRGSFGQFLNMRTIYGRDVGFLFLPMCVRALWE